MKYLFIFSLLLIIGSSNLFSCETISNLKLQFPETRQKCTKDGNQIAFTTSFYETGKLLTIDIRGTLFIPALKIKDIETCNDNSPLYSLKRMYDATKNHDLETILANTYFKTKEERVALRKMYDKPNMYNLLFKMIGQKEIVVVAYLSEDFVLVIDNFGWYTPLSKINGRWLIDIKQNLDLKAKSRIVDFMNFLKQSDKDKLTKIKILKSK